MRNQLAIALGIWFVTNVGIAQDIRVHTRIYAADNPEPIVRSLTMFHAGRVFDYIEPAMEITIYEPAIRKFTVINKNRQLRSQISQDQIRHYLGAVQDDAVKLLNSPPQGINRKTLDLIGFQLQPQFTTEYDPSKNQLTLSSPEWKYVVKTMSPQTPEVVEKYLQVADWTAQLNSVLHPKAPLPAPRMALNRELRQRGLLPESVELTINDEHPVHLVAHHEWTWNLQKTDRQMIDSWESDADLQNVSIRQVPFTKFQQDTLRNAAKKPK